MSIRTFRMSGRNLCYSKIQLLPDKVARRDYLNSPCLPDAPVGRFQRLFIICITCLLFGADLVLTTNLRTRGDLHWHHGTEFIVY